MSGAVILRPGKIEHLFLRDKAHKTKTCVFPGCGQRSATHVSALEVAFDKAVEASGIGITAGMVKEYDFAGRVDRKWRADRAWPACRVMVELDGGSFMAQGHHTVGVDRARDNFAALDGWIVLRFDMHMLRAGLALWHVSAALMIRMVGPQHRKVLSAQMFPPPKAMKALLKVPRKKAAKRK